MEGMAAYGGVIVGEEVLQSFHEAPTHVARLRSLHSRVHQALSAGHGVKEELCGCKPAVEAVRHKAPAVWGPADPDIQCDQFARQRYLMQDQTDMVKRVH